MRLHIERYKSYFKINVISKAGADVVRTISSTLMRFSSGQYVCPLAKFQIQSFGVLKNRPCPCQFLTNLCVIRHHFCLVLCPCLKAMSLVGIYP